MNTPLTTDDRVSFETLQGITKNGTCSPHWGASALLRIAQEALESRVEIQLLKTLIADADRALYEWLPVPGDEKIKEALMTRIDKALEGFPRPFRLNEKSEGVDG